MFYAEIVFHSFLDSTKNNKNVFDFSSFFLLLMHIYSRTINKLVANSFSQLLKNQVFPLRTQKYGSYITTKRMCF